jgi:hypothetical protein
MSHPFSMPLRSPFTAVLATVLLATGTCALAATPHDGAFEAAGLRGTVFTDALVPGSTASAHGPDELLPAHSGDAADACMDGACAGQDPAARSGTDIAAADTRNAATPAPPATPVRAGVDGKPAGIGSVPEPQTYALLCGGLGLLGVSARTSRRRRQPE